MKAKRMIWIGGTLVCLLAVVFTVLSMNGERMFRLRSFARKQWKEKALIEIAERAKALAMYRTSWLNYGWR